jgi:phosphate transport system permease protein
MSVETPSSDFDLPMTGSAGRRLGDRTLLGVSLLGVAGLSLLMLLLIYKVVDQARPAISEFGLSFLTGTTWNAVTNEFGALDLIWGTLATSLFALVIAVPVAIAIALFLTELAPRVLRTPIGMMVELLAAIPSVVLGLWGIVVMGPFLQAHVEPWMIDHLGFIPFFDGYPSGVGLLPACLILAVMIVPIVASISRELLLSVPSDLKGGALALGATRWEMVRRVMLPQVTGGLVAGVMLGFARAAGEAIAVSQVIGGSLVRPQNIYAPADTMAARLAAQYAGTATDLQKASLAYLAVILLVLSLMTNLVAQMIVRRSQRRLGAR